MTNFQATKQEIIEQYKLSGQDTGSTPVQCISLTERINQITAHLKNHKKDFAAQRGLLVLVGKRRRLLDYLKKKKAESYTALIKSLGLRK